jgi:hypothetical protein
VDRKVLADLAVHEPDAFGAIVAQASGLHVGAELYAGPSIPLLIANDPGDLFGKVTAAGYPSNDSHPDIGPGEAGDLVYDSMTLAAGGGSYFSTVADGDPGGVFQIVGLDAAGGMSGGGLFIEFDPDGAGGADARNLSDRKPVFGWVDGRDPIRPGHRDRTALPRSCSGARCRRDTQRQPVRTRHGAFVWAGRR